MLERYQMVFVFNRGSWVGRDMVEEGRFFRLGMNLYVATVVSGETVLARPHHDPWCAGPIHDEWIPIEAYRQAMEETI
jgi:hypothetical protein